MRIHPNAEDGGEEPSREDAEFARQLAAVLRTAESPRADFDDRVRAAVRAAHEAPSAARVLRFAPRPSEWRRPRIVALPPVAWGAVAAGFAAIVSVGTLSLARNTGGSQARHVASAKQGSTVHPAVVLPERDTVYVVRFVLADARARTVSLVGDFNAWAKRATPLTAAKAGVWSTQVALPAGRHEYAFVVDGKRWVADPAADRLTDDFDTPSSVVTVGGGGVAEK
jgi:hypothetical protein